ncbi:short chain dehydrogenase/reductase [Aspergillus arachidicola]|uniref:Short chain dehydrogenase/reductase n=1 Tax=Aspergillus arachidicola TaxID=656916 RepID=A0A2G7G0K6_9EURO|nr:short chain dehydrogenase/reductase [Aspergillus arachidicola]
MSGFFTYRQFSLYDTPSLANQVAVVTVKITAQLLLHGIEKVYVLARSHDKYIRAQEEWQRRIGGSLGKGNTRVQFIQCDLADIVAAKNAANKLKHKTDRLDIMICNAAIGVSTNYERSPQGIEQVFASNCVGHQVLATNLLPLMKRTINQGKASNGRIAVASSSMHAFCCELNLDLLTSPTRLKPAYIDGVWRYARAKVGNILFARELSLRLMQEEDPASSKIYVNAFFPGNIVTDQWSVWDEYIGEAWVPCLGAYSQSLVRAWKMYFIPIAKPYKTTAIASDMKLARDLWGVLSRMKDHYLLGGLFYAQDWTEAKAAEALGPEEQAKTRTVDG